MNSEDKEHIISKTVQTNEQNHDKRRNRSWLGKTRCPANKGAVAIKPHPQFNDVVFIIFLSPKFCEIKKFYFKNLELTFQLKKKLHLCIYKWIHHLLQVVTC